MNQVNKGESKNNRSRKSVRLMASAGLISVFALNLLASNGCSNRNTESNPINISTQTSTESSLQNIEPSASLTSTSMPTITKTHSPTASLWPTATPNPLEQACGSSLVMASSDELDKTGELSMTDPRYIIPQYITLHWDGQPGAPNGWTADRTWRFFSQNQMMETPDPDGGLYNYASHFATGPDGIYQMLDMREACVQRSHAVRGYPYDISIEMAGVDFKYYGDRTNVTKKEMEYTIELVKLLMDTYDIPLENVVGHFEHDTYPDKNGKMKDWGKPDPGPTFMKYFKQVLADELSGKLSDSD